jgi:hypothetical protein
MIGLASGWVAYGVKVSIGRACMECIEVHELGAVVQVFNSFLDRDSPYKKKIVNGSYFTL